LLTLTPKPGSGFGMSIASNLSITKVTAQSAAERAGVVVGATILSINGQATDSKASIVAVLKTKPKSVVLGLVPPAPVPAATELPAGADLSSEKEQEEQQQQQQEPTGLGKPKGGGAGAPETAVTPQASGSGSTAAPATADPVEVAGGIAVGERASGAIADLEGMFDGAKERMQQQTDVAPAPTSSASVEGGLQLAHVRCTSLLLTVVMW
jgi:membrane-associated protease RseP (regulator of RpoE activity)